MKTQSRGRLLMTGATGLLGRYLVRDLLSADVPLAIIVRPSRSRSAEMRVDDLVRSLEAEVGRTLPRPEVLSGDLTTPQLGLDEANIRWIATHCDRILHNAASLNFQSTHHADEPWLTNVRGTRHVLELCQLAGIRDFHHVSTAYVCGLRSGRVLEDELDVGQNWGNCYEKSKVEAEQMVRGADYLSRVTIYRPSIIVGDSQTGFTSTFHGLYAVVKIAHTLARRLVIGSISPELIFEALAVRRDDRKNFVPVDWVARSMVRLLQRPAAWGRTFHLTSPHATSTKEWGTAVFDAVTQLSPTADPEDVYRGDLSWFERLFREQMEYYRPYWRDDPEFDTANLLTHAPDAPCPHIDYAMIYRMAEFAVRSGFGKRPLHSRMKRTTTGDVSSADAMEASGLTSDAPTVPAASPATRMTGILVPNERS